MNKLGKIIRVTFFSDVRIDDERIDVLTIELEKEQMIILDVSYGLTIDDLDITKKSIKNTASNFKILYDFNEVDYQTDIDFKEIYVVKLHKNAVLVNKLRDTKLEKSDYLEIIDADGNNIFIDILTNHLYKRVNLYKIIDEKNVITVFERYNTHRVKTWMFYNPFKTIINILDYWD